ncbi:MULTISPECIES: hypothetical protein [unclassified Kitasatospora]|uniref:hypothetical protein n=1 Tax=unclassified Kitasatospora TaxID=2633591 RepID=UPI0033C5D9A0
MAEKLTALSDLKDKFGKYPQLADLFTDIETWTGQINLYNKESAGNDEIGKKYHENVDAPTESIIKLLKSVRSTVESAGTGGTNTANILNDADHEAGNSV